MRSAIALLITMMFVMLISVGIGYGLTQVKEASQTVEEEDLLYESSMVLGDLLTMLQSSSRLIQLSDENATDQLYQFLQSSNFLPLSLGNEKVIISFSSARKKININSINKTNEPLFLAYFNRYHIENNYVDILKESMQDSQENNNTHNVTSGLFEENPTLFREYIASKKQLDIINNYYLNEYDNRNLEKIPFDELFRYGPYNEEALDLNYVTVSVWELITGATKERATQLFDQEGSYRSLSDLGLTPKESENIAKFKTTFFAPFLAVKVKIIRDVKSINIYFKYDIKLKKGYDFVYEV